MERGGMAFSDSCGGGGGGFPLLRRKRPLSPRAAECAASTAFAGLARPTAGPSAPSVLLPALSDLLASQQHEEPRLSPLRQRSVPSALDAYAPVVDAPVAMATDETEDDEEDKTPWPSAAQYREIFADPLRAGDVPVYDLGLDPRGVPLHPEFIYSQPASCMYFLKCARLLGKGSFGFPRKAKKQPEAPEAGRRAVRGGRKEPSKEFEWRKMSFVTGLPKKQPVVRYVTATCYSRATDVAAKKKVFRMHAVMLADEAGTGETGEYVLVHIRAGGSKRVGLRASLAAEPDMQPHPQLVPNQSVPTPRSPLLQHEEQAAPVRRPVSPPMAAVSSYNSQAASTSPRNKKRRVSEFAPSNELLNGRLASAPAASSVRHSLFAPSPADAKVNSARLAVRELILNACSSRDEVAQYVLGLQEELAALQRQSN